nr:prepilin peptidase [Halorubellus sp. JP-L1]
MRLLVVPFFAWAAYTDVKTRRIPNRVWPPLFVAGVVLLALTVQQALAPGAPYASRVLPGMVVSLGVVGPVAYLFWLFGGFGGADAKALLVLALLFPIYPAYDVAGVVLPLPGNENALGSFAFTILTNTVVVGVLYPTALAARNAANGEFSLPMFLGKRVPASAVVDQYGTLMGTNDGMDAGSLDLDALRMYLTWRGTTLAAVRGNADELRDPASLPEDRNDPGGGQVAEGIDDECVDSEPARAPDHGDGAVDSDAEPDVSGTIDDTAGEDAASEDDTAGEDAASEDDAASEEDGTYEDAWGAELFLEEVEGDAYGTSPDALRDGLDVLADAEGVWVSPGIPFIVPMFLGLVLALTVGDLLSAAVPML